MYIPLVNIKKEFYNPPYYDLGLAFLRPILSFLVIMHHFHKYSLDTGIFKLFYERLINFTFHVPNFFIMAFYFSHKTLISKDYKKKLNRLKRLVIPYFLWPIIVYFLNKIITKYIKQNSTIDLEDLKIQFLCGFKFIYSLWYQWNLVVITIFYMLILLILKKYINLVLILIAIQAFILQYNGNLYNYIYKFVDSRETLGKFIEMIPYSVTGFVIASSGILKYLKKYKIQLIIVYIYIIYFICNNPVLSSAIGYGYGGLKLYIISTGIFISFAMFPSEKIKNKYIIKLVKLITNHTAGIYYCHIIVYRYTQFYIQPIKDGTIKGCIIIYLISYLICFIGSFIFGNTILRHLFE